MEGNFIIIFTLLHHCCFLLTSSALAPLQALQVFESHAGILGPVQFQEFSLPYLRDIARRVKDRLKEAGQDVPMVGSAHLRRLLLLHSSSDHSSKPLLDCPYF